MNSLLIVFGHRDKMVNGETAFSKSQYGGKIIHWISQQKIDTKDSNILALNMSIYGLVQASIHYHKRAVKILYKIGIMGRGVGPCLL